MDNQTTITVQGSETRVDTQKKPGGFYSGKPTLKTIKKPHPKFNPFSFLVLLITKDFISLKALEKL